MAALRSRCGHYIFALWFLSFFFLSIFFLAESQRSEIGCPQYLHTWCGLNSANLERMSEMCCTRLAENTGRKKSPFWHHRTTLSGSIFEAKHVSTSGKNLLNIDISSTCHRNMVNFGLLTAEIWWQVWGTPANFNGFRVLAPLLHGNLVVSVSQTLQRWT